MLISGKLANEAHAREEAYRMTGIRALSCTAPNPSSLAGERGCWRSHCGLGGQTLYAPAQVGVLEVKRKTSALYKRANHPLIARESSLYHLTPDASGGVWALYRLSREFDPPAGKTHPPSQRWGVFENHGK